MQDCHQVRQAPARQWDRDGLASLSELAFHLDLNTQKLINQQVEKEREVGG
jgi:hypothetical protein